MTKILLVEDEPDTRELVRLTLELYGYDVVEACEAEDGIAKAYQSRPALILMDLSLAGRFDGLEATKRLRADPEFDSTPIVALTAHAMAGDREKILGAGCDGYIPKPVDPQGLAAEVSQYLRQGRLKTA